MSELGDRQRLGLTQQWIRGEAFSNSSRPVVGTDAEKNLIGNQKLPVDSIRRHEDAESQSKYTKGCGRPSLHSIARETAKHPTSGWIFKFHQADLPRKSGNVRFGGGSGGPYLP